MLSLSQIDIYEPGVQWGDEISLDVFGTPLVVKASRHA